MLSLQTLGSVDLLDGKDGRQLLSVLAQPKRVGFLTYLAVASPRGMHPRETIVGIFWPDSSDKRARNALNQTTFVLRRALGQDVLRVNGETGIGVDPNHLSCDVWDFEKALAEGEKEEALDLYRGNFLDGFYLPGCLGFERWVDSQRSRLRDLATGAVLSLSREMESAGNPVGAVGWLRRAREWAAYDELVLRRQMELLLALGDRSGAVREYEAFARRLSVDLGLEPSKEVRDLLDKPPRVVGLSMATDGPDAHGPVPMPQGAVVEPATGRRSSLPGVGTVALLAAAMGVGGALLAPGFRTAGTQTQAPLSNLPMNPLHGTELGPRTLAFLPFDNATGDPALEGLGETAANEIRLAAAARGLLTMGPAMAGDAPAEAPGTGPNEAPGEPTEETDETAPSMWQLKEAAYVVTGSYFENDGSLVYRARIMDAQSGTIVASMDTVMGSRADPSEALQRLKGQVAGTLAMVLDPWFAGLASVSSHPGSFEAYQLLSDAFDLHFRAFGATSMEARWALLDSADQAFDRAATADPGFTLPRVFALWYGNVASPAWASHLQALELLRDELPPWERAMLDVYLAIRDRDLTGEYQAMVRAVDLYPTPDWILRLAVSALATNRPRQVLELLQPLESEREWLEEGGPRYWGARAQAKIMLGDYDGALGDIEQARELSESSVSIGLIPREIEALARAGRGKEAVRRSIQHLESTPSPDRDGLWDWLPRVLLGAGRPDEARQLAEASVASLRAMEQPPPYSLERALALAGRYDEARAELSLAEGAEDVSLPYAHHALLAYMAAKEGDADEAIRLSEAARTTAAAAGPQAEKWGILSQVEVAAQLGDYGRAVRLLREALTLGLQKGTWATTRWDLTPLYGYRPFEEMMRPKG